VASGTITAADAAVPVLVALTTNTISKAVVAYVFGRRRYAVEVWVGLVLVIAAAWGGFILQMAL
jgi:uncharacterized membrane protein (DUF4010 family)